MHPVLQNLLFIPILFCLIFTANAQNSTITDTVFLKKIMKTGSKDLKKILDNPEKYRVQIIYTQINRDKNKNLSLKHFAYRNRPEEYFYPASTVKLAASLHAIEKINSLSQNGVFKDTKIGFDGSCKCFSELKKDSLTSDSIPTIENYILKALVLSDNESYNRIYDFIGQRYLNQRLWELGYSNARIVNKFISCDSLDNSCTNGFVFFNKDNDTLFSQLPEYNSINFSPPFHDMKIGKQFKQGKTILDEPHDFSSANSMPLSYTHDMLIRLIYPQLYKQEEQFCIKEKDREFLKKCLSAKPSETEIPKFQNKEKYWNTYTNYLYYGWDKKAIINENIKIYNIVGLSYGFSVDCAYITDTTKGVEFFLSTVIYTNEDEILNNDKYEYKTVAMPFLKNLGRLIYNYELSRDAWSKEK
ncbi:MAG: hypothetical protein A2275_12640 [Bacteroidetes bacterium RIFOXYA12_FULL_35_11]|nr:MAG: hypothetical protein A2X01_00355 [Bacteroidetes bacterium GWF2_35_48]OFY74382.1 MAG: hypothetical protein A2275_12640 [Bacteroidetes bacterium RIFOXYA12_FULL_35_11]OFY96870.1 MAG: hypothetical protein A2309_11235 [Bacteroidetes bacterium RIFOXYB2_FULL_35_7]HBX53309.1 hypothetical protein [Bacteroidales bacterium]